jgi:hypothetical protein
MFHIVFVHYLISTHSLSLLLLIVTVWCERRPGSGWCGRWRRGAGARRGRRRDIARRQARLCERRRSAGVSGNGERQRGVHLMVVFALQFLSSLSMCFLSFLMFSYSRVFFSLPTHFVPYPLVLCRCVGFAVWCERRPNGGRCWRRQRGGAQRGRLCERRWREDARRPSACLCVGAQGG